MNIRPLHDKIIIEKVEEKLTSSGIVIPSTVNDKPQRGIVKSVGPGKFVNGVFNKLVVKLNDEVIFTRYSGTEIKVNGKEMLVIKEEDIIGIIEN